MARNRMLNPEFWLDEEVATVSAHARLLYMGLWGICDDNYATFPDRPEWIKVQIFPYEEVDINSLLKELEKIGKIIKFESENKNYWFIKNFLKHQRVEKPSKPKYPEFINLLQNSRGIVGEKSGNSRAEEKRREVKRSKEKIVDEASTPFIWKEYLEEMEKSERRDIRLIAYYFKKRGKEFKDKEETQEAISRHIKSASKVAKFKDNNVIMEAFEDCEKMKGIEYTLETVLKVLTK